MTPAWRQRLALTTACVTRTSAGRRFRALARASNASIPTIAADIVGRCMLLALELARAADVADNRCHSRNECRLLKSECMNRTTGCQHLADTRRTASHRGVSVHQHLEAMLQAGFAARVTIRRRRCQRAESSRSVIHLPVIHVRVVLGTVGRSARLSQGGRCDSEHHQLASLHGCSQARRRGSANSHPSCQCDGAD